MTPNPDVRSEHTVTGSQPNGWEADGRAGSRLHEGVGSGNTLSPFLACAAISFHPVKLGAISSESFVGQEDLD